MCSSNKRKVTFLKENLFKLAWKTDKKINKKVELGIVEAVQSKKTYKIRRVGDFLFAGYEKDPLFNKRLSVILVKDDLNTKSYLGTKVNWDVGESMKNFILNGAIVSTEPTKYIKKTLNTQQKVSDSNKINTFVEEYSQYDEWIIEKSKEIEEILMESKFQSLLMNNYNAEIEGDNIKTDNSWIQLPLSMIIMAKDFLYQSNYFNISDNAKDSNSPKILLYDPYWNFGQNDGLFEVESSSSEYNSIVKNQKCKLKKFQSKSLNYSYRSLVNYYHWNRTSFEVNKYLVALDDDSLEELEEINDMSHLLLFMTQFELSKVKKLPLKALESDTYLLIEKIELFENSSNYYIPAMLPLYEIKVPKKKKKSNDAKNNKKKKNKKNKNSSESDDEE